MATQVINELGHTFHNTELGYYRCSKCNVEIYASENNGYIVPERSLSDPKHCVLWLKDKLTLTCEEQIIKGIIE